MYTHIQNCAISVHITAQFLQVLEGVDIYSNPSKLNDYNIFRTQSLSFYNISIIWSEITFGIKKRNSRLILQTHNMVIEMRFKKFYLKYNM